MGNNNKPGLHCDASNKQLSENVLDPYKINAE